MQCEKQETIKKGEMKMEKEKQKNIIEGWPRVSRKTGEKYVYIKVTIDGVETAFSLERNIYKKTEKQPAYFGLEIVEYNNYKQGIKAGVITEEELKHPEVFVGFDYDK